MSKSVPEKSANNNAVWLLQDLVDALERFFDLYVTPEQRMSGQRYQRLIYELGKAQRFLRTVDKEQ